MEEERTQVVSLRLSEESYGKLKAYAEAHGESVSDAVRQAIEEMLAGNSAPVSPVPTPAPSPPPPLPGPGPESGSADEVRLGLEALVGREEETRRYVLDMAWRLNDVQATVNKIMALLTPYLPPPAPVPFPGFPPPPWQPFSVALGGQAAEAFGELGDQDPG